MNSSCRPWRPLRANPAPKSADAASEWPIRWMSISILSLTSGRRGSSIGTKSSILDWPCFRDPTPIPQRGSRGDPDYSFHRVRDYGLPVWQVQRRRWWRPRSRPLSLSTLKDFAMELLFTLGLVAAVTYCAFRHGKRLGSRLAFRVGKRAGRRMRWRRGP